MGYLVSVGAGTFNDVTPQNSETVNIYPNTEIHALVGKPEVKSQGLYRIPVRIVIKGSAVEDAQNTEYEKARKAFDARVALTMDKLMQTDDDETLKYTATQITLAGRALKTNSDPNIAAANQDMDAFSLTQWYDGGMGDGSEVDHVGCSWVEVLLFEAVACASNVD